MDIIFVARIAGGVEVRESEQFFWDHVPNRIERLTLVGRRDVFVNIPAAPGRRFFFSNEGVAARDGSRQLHSAKIIGCIDGEEVKEFRLELLGKTPVLRRRTYPFSQFVFCEAVLRTSA